MSGPGHQAFNFVEYNPDKDKAAAARKRVRSIAAEKSWKSRPRRRKGPEKDREESNQSAAGTASSSSSKAPVGRPRTTAKSRAAARGRKEALPAEGREGLALDDTSSTTGRSQSIVLAKSHSLIARADQKLPSRLANPETPPESPGYFFNALPNEVPASYSHASSDSDKYAGPAREALQVPFAGDLTNAALLTPTSLPRTPTSSTGVIDPFDCYPVPYQPCFDGILHHMMTVFAPRAWPHFGITNEQGIHWEQFMTQHALSEPALFYVRLLFASGDLVRFHAVNPSIRMWLQSKAVETINEALRDPARATSDALILAVGRIALHECWYGDRQAANAMHRPAQQRMIELRGGMGNLEFPDLVKRLMRWTDRVMSVQGNTKRFIPDEAEQRPGGNFTMGQSVGALDSWVPKESQEFRRKIRISDLVNE